MEKGFPEFKKGEREFLEHFERRYPFKDRGPEEAKEQIKETLQDLTKEIEVIPQIKKEAEIHHLPLSDLSNVLTYALHLVLENGLVEGLSYIKKMNNPHLLDAFHDLLVGHFYDLLKKHRKIK